MRRKDKEILEPALLQSILEEAEVCRLALANGDEPYIVPVNFVYHENCLFIHSAREGRKLEMLRKNNRVCFEAETRVEILPGEQACNWTTRYMSVIGYGRVSLLDDLETKKAVLDRLMWKYAGEGEYTYSVASLERIVVLKVEITELSGKKSRV